MTAEPVWTHEAGHASAYMEEDGDGLALTLHGRAKLTVQLEPDEVAELAESLLTWLSGGPPNPSESPAPPSALPCR